MGQKYLPSVRDQKANLRFQQQQAARKKKPAPSDLPAKKSKQK